MNYHYLVLAALLLAPPALAQTPPADPEKQALSQAILDLTRQNIALRTQLIEEKQKNADLRKQAAPLQPPTGGLGADRAEQDGGKK